VLVNLGLDQSSGQGSNNIDSVSATNYKTGGVRNNYQQQKVNQLADVSLFYSKELKSIKGKIDVLVGHSYQSFLTKVTNNASFSYRAIADLNRSARIPTGELFWTSKLFDTG
jgi:iron complex outermembrane receptor protein